MKKIYILSAFLILILAMGVVSAEDNQINKTFDTIQTQVNDAGDNDVIQLNGYYSGEKEVSISKSITIQGSYNKTTLDGKSISRAFNVKNGDVTFKNLKFVNCIGDNGGAVYTESSCIFIDCIFIDNHAVKGGAIYSQSDVTILNSVFENNTAGENGGAIFSKCTYADNKLLIANVNIKNTNFTNNYANCGGAITSDLSGIRLKSTTHETLNIENSQFQKNSASKFGGVIFYIADSDLCKLIVKNSIFDQNSAQEGGAIDLSVGSAYVSNCNFSNNKAENGAVAVSFSNNVLIEKSHFISNTADTISAIMLFWAEVTVSDCTFQNNSLGVLNGNSDSKLTIINNKQKTVYSGIVVLDNSFKKINLVKVVAKNLVSTYNSGEKLKLTLINTYNSNPAPYFSFVIVCVDGKKVKSYSRTTDAEGIYIFKVTSSLPVGKYKVTFEGDGWSDVSGTLTFTIKKAKTIVKASKVTNKYKKSQYFKITIHDKATKKLLPYNTKIKVKVYTGKKAKIYTLKIKNNGVAKFNTKKLSKGTHKVVIKSATGNYNINKNSKIKII